jgi:hypothetical protein
MFDHHTTLKVEILRLSKNHSSELEEIVLPHETIYVASIQQTLVGYMSTYDKGPFSMVTNMFLFILDQ